MPCSKLLYKTWCCIFERWSRSVHYSDHISCTCLVIKNNNCGAVLPHFYLFALRESFKQWCLVGFFLILHTEMFLSPFIRSSCTSLLVNQRFSQLLWSNIYSPLKIPCFFGFSGTTHCKLMNKAVSCVSGNF